jgi:hypothetical protein
MKKAGLSSILIAVTLLAVAVTVEAQQPKKVVIWEDRFGADDSKYAALLLSPHQPASISHRCGQGTSTPDT